MNYLQFYLERDCVLVPCRPGTKKLIRGAGSWTAQDSRAQQARLLGNAAMRNGTGGLLVVDIDAKNGGSLGLMSRLFPGSTHTRTIQTVTPGKDGLGLQLIYALPAGFRIKPTLLAHNSEGRPMIEVAAFAMLPGSKARGADYVLRTYELMTDVPPAPAPPELLAVVEARRTAGAIQPSDDEDNPRAARSSLEIRLARIASANEGQRNFALTQNALPIVRLCNVLGEDPEAQLQAAYRQSGGKESRWLEAAVRSAIRRAAEEPAGEFELGPLAKNRLVEMQRWARFAPWPGQSGPSDRRVFLALISSCLEYGRNDSALGSRKLGLKAGLSKETVDASLKRLEASGRISALKAGPYIVRRPMLTPEDNEHILPPLVRGIISSECVCEELEPLHMVWSVPSTDRGAGLNGRHGHLFDLVCAGLSTSRALGDYIGSRPDSLSRTLRRLVEVGLLVRSGSRYVPSEDIRSVADAASLELGGVAACAHRENHYRDEEKLWRDAQARWESEYESWSLNGPIIEAFSDPFGDDLFLADWFDEHTVAQKGSALLKEDEDMRRWYEEQQLLIQLGLPSQIEF